MAPRSYVHAPHEQWQKLAAAVRQRRIELGLTQATAVARSGGLISSAVWSILEGARQVHGRMEERTLSGADHALGWEPGHALTILTGHQQVQTAPGDGAATGGDQDVTGIAAKAGRLTPEQRTRLIGYIDALLDEDPSSDK